MLAEKMADMILGNKPLKASEVDVWIDSNWQVTQRSGHPYRAS
jgi:choline dehydrogenase